MKTENGHTPELDVPQMSAAFVPTPTREYREHRKSAKITLGAGMPVLHPIPLPFPVVRGSRVLIYKQDPSVTEIGIRKAYLPNSILSGPRDARISSEGLPKVSPNAMNDFIETP